MVAKICDVAIYTCVVPFGLRPLNPLVRFSRICITTAALRRVAVRACDEIEAQRYSVDMHM